MKPAIKPTTTAQSKKPTASSQTGQQNKASASTASTQAKKDVSTKDTSGGVQLRNSSSLTTNNNNSLNSTNTSMKNVASKQMPSNTIDNNSMNAIPKNMIINPLITQDKKFDTPSQPLGTTGTNMQKSTQQTFQKVQQGDSRLAVTKTEVESKQFKETLMNKGGGESSDEDEDELTQAKKNKANINNKKNTKIPNETIDFNDANAVMSMLKARGLTYEDSEIKQGNAFGKDGIGERPKTKVNMIPGQASANIKELKMELDSALKQNNLSLAVSIIDSLLGKSLANDEAINYKIQKSNFLMNLKRYKECLSLSQEIIEQQIGNSQYNIILKLYIQITKARLELSQIWDGYFDYQKAQAFVKEIQNTQNLSPEKKYSNFKYDDTKTWKDSETDSLIKILDEIALNYQVKISKDKFTTNTVYATGMNMSSGLLGLGKNDQMKIHEKPTSKILPELKNRKVLQVVCGDHHTLVLVEPTYYNLFDIDLTNTKEGSKTYDEDERRNNLQTDIFGWGENTCGQITGNSIVEFIDKPTLVKNFIGKRIKGIAACRARSLAYDSKGQVFEWGFSNGTNDKIQLVQTFKDGLKKCIMGPDHNIVLTELENRIYFWGNLHCPQGVILSSNGANPLEIKKSFKAVDITCGTCHILALSEQNEIYALGSNHNGQLGLNDMKPYIKEFKKIDIYDKPQKIYAFNDISCFLNEDREFYVWGKLSPSTDKIQAIPIPCDIDSDAKIINVAGNSVEIFAINEKGETYQWDLAGGSRFRRYPNTDYDSFREIIIGKGFQILVKYPIEPSLCYTIDDIDTDYTSMSPICIQLQLIDQNGKYGNKLSLPLRICAIFTKKIMENNTLKERVLEEEKKFYQKKENNYLYFINHSEFEISNISIEVNPDDSSIYDLKFAIPKEGIYYLYLFLNENLISNMPKKLQLSKSEAEAKKEEEEDLEAKKFLDEKLKKEELQKMKYLEEQKSLEEKEQKLKSTMQRAEESFKKHLAEQKELAKKQEEERRMKKEMLTGGGFNLDKMDSIKSKKKQKMIFKF